MTKKVKAGQTAKKQQVGIPFQKGPDPRRNLDGRPTGAEGFKTMFMRAIEKVAKDTGGKAEDQEMQIIARGVLEARKGNFPFYKDMLDRVYGKAPQTIDLNATINKEELTDQEKDMLNRLVGDE